MTAGISLPFLFDANTGLLEFTKFDKRHTNAGNMGCGAKSPHIAEFGT
jgi:hypothetical protein